MISVFGTLTNLKTLENTLHFLNAFFLLVECLFSIRPHFLVHLNKLHPFCWFIQLFAYFLMGRLTQILELDFEGLAIFFLEFFYYRFFFYFKRRLALSSSLSKSRPLLSFLRKGNGLNFYFTHWPQSISFCLLLLTLLHSESRVIDSLIGHLLTSLVFVNISNRLAQSEIQFLYFFLICLQFDLLRFPDWTPEGLCFVSCLSFNFIYFYERRASLGWYFKLNALIHMRHSYQIFIAYCFFQLLLWLDFFLFPHFYFGFSSLPLWIEVHFADLVGRYLNEPPELLLVLELLSSDELLSR